jgi:hypothetical protein
MEQRLDATYLRSGPFERAAAVGFCAVAIGAGILLAAWGISLLWRYRPPEIHVRIANPEVRVTQDAPLKVAQDKPFVIAQPEPFKVERGEPTIKVEQGSPSVTSRDTNTPSGDSIRREVTVFSNVKHGAGTVVTGWSYRDGSGRVPIRQYCYYTTPNVDHSSKRVDIASNRVRSSNIDADVVPDLEGALAKCQWWQA